MKTLVIGLGNPILKDDSIGLKVVKELAAELEGRKNVTVGEDYWGGLRLMERMIGYDQAIVVDAMPPGGEPGKISVLTPGSFPTQKSASAHDVNLPTALELGRKAGAHLPETKNIVLIGIEAEDVLNFGEECTPAVRAALPRAVDMVLETLDKKRN